jgi:serpin B
MIYQQTRNGVAKLRKSILLTIAAALLLASCGQKKPIPSNERARLAADADPRIAQAANAFGLDLSLKLIYEKPGQNVVLSPINVAQALSMTMSGAAGETREQMAAVLHAQGLSGDVLNEGQRKLRELLLQPGPGIRLSAANSLWLQQGWPFHKDYLDRVKAAYGAELNERNLTDPAVRKEINKWVDKQTGGNIHTMVDEPVTPDTKLMLLSALYFNGTWETPFESKDTKDGDFTKVDGKPQRVPFMHRSGTFEYDETDAYQAVRLPYGDGQMGMLVVLPRPSADRALLADQLFADAGFWSKPFQHYRGQLALPKFRIEGTLKLEDTLSAMGMSLAFDRNRADFSGMADTSNGRLLFIDRVLHKTLVDVSERGTEASAATLVGIKVGSAPPTGSFEMTVDRPFWFAIQDLQSGTLLFIGSVEEL